MADKVNYFTLLNKIFISYTKTIKKTKTVDILVDKILYYKCITTMKKKNFPR